MPQFSDIVTKAQELVGEVAGPGVQAFSEARMLNDAIRAFNMLFTKYNWEGYMEWSSHELNGSTGLFSSANFSRIRDFSDFRSIHRHGEPNQLSILPAHFNPYTMGHGSRPIFWTSLPVSHADYTTKRLQFYPFEATGFIDIHARIYPETPLTMESIVHLDEDLLVYATAFMGLALDDLNASGTEICKGFMDMRYKDILSALASHPVSTSSHAEPLSNWTQVP